MNDNPVLCLTSIEKDGCVRVAAQGDITAVEVNPATRNPLESILGETWSGNRVSLDLSRTEFLDSTGIAWLISTSKRFRSGGGALVVHSIAPRARQMLDLLKIGRIVSMVSDENAARKYLTGASSAQAA